MRIRAVHNLATWICLAVGLLVGAAPAEGLVLCLGSDGHIGVTPPADGCDGCPGGIPPGEGDSRPQPAGIDVDPTCCPCLDVPVMSGTDGVGPESPRPSPERPSSLPAMLPAHRMPAGPPRTTTPLITSPPDVGGVARSMLRSVILRF